MPPKDSSRESHFPAIEKKYGESMKFWFVVMKKVEGKKYPEQIAHLRENYGFSQVHANALVMYSRGSKSAISFDKPSDYFITLEPKQAKTVKKATRTAKRKEAVKKVANKLKTTGKAVIKVAGAPVRNSFLLLVKVNFKNLAGKLKRVYDTNPDKLKTFWSAFSGQWDSLVKAINTGYNKKALGYLGAPNPVAVAVTTASPILVKLSKFLKSIGIDPETIQELEQEKLNQVAQNVVSKVRKEAKEIEVEEKQEVAQTDKELSTEDSGSESGGSGLSKNTMLLIGAGAVGLFLLTRKK